LNVKGEGEEEEEEVVRGKVLLEIFNKEVEGKEETQALVTEVTEKLIEQ